MSTITPQQEEAFQKACEEWRDNIAKFLSHQSTTVSFNDISLYVSRPALLLNSNIALLDLFQADPLQRFAISGDVNNMRVRRIFRVDDDEIKDFVAEWRRLLAEYLSQQSSTVGLSDIGSNVVRPSRLPTSVKLVDVLRSDPLNRFIITGEGNNIRAKFNFHLNEEQIASLVDQWRENISRFLSTQSASMGLSDIGSHVARPFCLPNSIKLLETLQNDPKGRFAITGEGSSMRARRVFHVDDPEIFDFVEEWRLSIAHFLSLQYSTASLSDIGSNVSRPLRLPTSVKLVDVMRADPFARFSLMGDGNNIRAALASYVKSGLIKPSDMYYDASNDPDSLSLPLEAGFANPPVQADRRLTQMSQLGRSHSFPINKSGVTLLPPPFFPTSVRTSSSSPFGDHDDLALSEPALMPVNHASSFAYAPPHNSSPSSLNESFNGRAFGSALHSRGSGSGTAWNPNVAPYVPASHNIYPPRSHSLNGSLQPSSAYAQSFEDRRWPPARADSFRPPLAQSSTSHRFGGTGLSPSNSGQGFSAGASLLPPNNPPFLKASNMDAGVYPLSATFGANPESGSLGLGLASSFHRLNLAADPIFDNPKMDSRLAAPASLNLNLNYLGTTLNSNLSLPVAPSSPVPEEFLCAMTGEIMSDPVVCSDGYTYERSAIERLLYSGGRSPRTGVELVNATISPHVALRQAIEQFCLHKSQTQPQPQGHAGKVGAIGINTNEGLLGSALNNRGEWWGANNASLHSLAGSTGLDDADTRSSLSDYFAPTSDYFNLAAELTAKPTHLHALSPATSVVASTGDPQTDRADSLSPLSTEDSICPEGLQPLGLPPGINWNPIGCSPPRQLRKQSADQSDSYPLARWLPELFAGFDQELVSTFISKLREDGGFVSVKDLLDAKARSQLTPEMMQALAGLKLGHFNRLMNGLADWETKNNN